MVDALIKEVDSAVKADKWRALWQQFGKSVAWITAAVLLLTIGYVWFDGVRESYQQEVTGSLLSAQQSLAEENLEKATRTLTLSAQENAPLGVSESSLRSLILLQLASLPQHEKTLESQIATDVDSLNGNFSEVINHPNTGLALRQLWQLLQIRHAAQSEELVLNDAIMHVPSKGPFSSLIREQQAVLLAYSGKPIEAHAIISSLLEQKELVATQRTRLEMLLSQVRATPQQTEQTAQ